MLMGQFCDCGTLFSGFSSLNSFIFKYLKIEKLDFLLIFDPILPRQSGE